MFRGVSIMKVIKWFMFIIYVSFIVSCGGGGGSSPVSQYNGTETLEVASDNTGAVQIASNTSGILYDIQVTDSNGNPVGNMDVSYSEEDGKAVLLISDPNGVFGDVVMIGTPAELENRSGSTARAGTCILDIAMTPRNTNVIGFDTNAKNLSTVYFSDSAKAAMQSETGCYNPIEIIDKFKNMYNPNYEDSWSILMFAGGVTDPTAANVMYASYIMENSGYQMYAAFKTRLEYLNGVNSGNLDNEDFGFTCYYPSAFVGFDTICEVERNASACSSVSIPDETPADTPAETPDETPIETNSAPFIVGSPFTSVTADNTYVFYPASFDADGDAVTYSIENKPGWASFSTVTGALTGTPTEAQAGTYSNIVISVTDGEETDSLDAFSITVNLYNSPPVIGGTPFTTVTVDDTYAYYPFAYDADGDAVTYSIENKPGWASFSTVTGALTGTPTEAQAGAYSNIIISVTDGEVTDSLDAFSITVNLYNSPPVIGGTAFTAVTVGNDYEFYPVAYDADGDTLIYSIQNKPDWASFDTSTGALTGTPALSNAGAYSNIIISVTDGEETVSLDSFDITVSIDNSAPYIGGTPVTSATAGQVYSYTPGSYDADGDTLTFSIENKPSWASFNTSTGALTGSPVRADAGVDSNIVISVTDGAETVFLASFDITVGIENSAPTIGGTPDTYIQGGNAYSFTPTTSDEDGNTLIFSIENKPSWASFDMATGALTGTPADVNSGEYPDIIISVSDGQASSSIAAFCIVVYPTTVVLHNNLMWQDDAAAGTNQRSFSSGSSYCNNLTLGNFTDWRLPSLSELRTIRNSSNYPKVISDINNVAESFYWSASNTSYSTSFAYCIDFRDLSEFAYLKSYTGYIRCVR